MSKFSVGDKVTPRHSVEPFYSNYGENPRVIIAPGQIGVVKAIKVPVVATTQGRITFNCVDFELYEVYQGNPCFKNCIWRCSLSDSEIDHI